MPIVLDVADVAGKGAGGRVCPSPGGGVGNFCEWHALPRCVFGGDVHTKYVFVIYAPVAACFVVGIAGPGTVGRAGPAVGGGVADVVGCGWLDEGPVFRGGADAGDIIGVDAGITGWVVVGVAGPGAFSGRAPGASGVSIGYCDGSELGGRVLRDAERSCAVDFFGGQALAIFQSVVGVAYPVAFRNG